MSNLTSCRALTFNLVLDNGRSKQPDASFGPRGLPPPSRNNNIKIRPGSYSSYPTFVFEIAYANEDRERLLRDADEKHLSPNTSVNVWLGIKVQTSTTGITFWAGWGRRKLVGNGLHLEEQTQDANGVSAYYPVQTENPLMRQLTIPSMYIFHPLPSPPHLPQSFVLSFEDVRQAIEDGLQWL